MDLPKKRSLSDMQDLESPLQLGSEDCDMYSMTVLRYEKGRTEEDVDRNFLQMALDLGINVPQDPKTTLDLVTSNVDALALTSTPIEPCNAPSWNSQSTHPTSCSSSEKQQLPTKASSRTNTSIISYSPSINSIEVKKSSYLRRGIRRMSVFRRRKTMTAIPALPLTISTIQTLRNSQDRRPASAGSASPLSIPNRPETPLVEDTPPPDSPTASPEDLLAAQQRSLSSPHLLALRTSQLSEQSRFLDYSSTQYTHLHTFHQSHLAQTITTQAHLTTTLTTTHTNALSHLETHHLSAEVDLQRALKLERQACHTRLKHMEAYCSSIPHLNMPPRTVTPKDHRELAQQYHLRNGMDNLHSARINVLREKQARQLERVAAKQEAEAEELRERLKLEREDLERGFVEEEKVLKREFADRRGRLEARWALAEAIERRKLDIRTGEVHGPLLAIEWPDRGPEDGTAPG